MAKFESKKEFVPKNNKELALRMFKTILLQMGKDGKDPVIIYTFVKNPCPETLELEPDPYSPRDMLYEQIKKFSSLEEREAIFQELLNTQQI